MKNNTEDIALIAQMNHEQRGAALAIFLDLFDEMDNIMPHNTTPPNHK